MCVCFTVHTCTDVIACSFYLVPDEFLLCVAFPHFLTHTHVHTHTHTTTTTTTTTTRNTCRPAQSSSKTVSWCRHTSSHRRSTTHGSTRNPPNKTKPNVRGVHTTAAALGIGQPLAAHALQQCLISYLQTFYRPLSPATHPHPHPTHSRTHMIEFNPNVPTSALSLFLGKNRPTC